MIDELQEVQNDGIATLTLNRPESRNALTSEMMVGLREACLLYTSDAADE